MNEKAIEKFWLRVDRSAGAGACWPWTAGKCGGGYGTFRPGEGLTLGAHRVSYELRNGPIPAGVFVLHRCDNPACCNPAHLFLGTHAENMADMVAKGRQAVVRVTGERNPAHKLTTPQVAEVLQRLAAGESRNSVARSFGIGFSTVTALARGKTWRDVATPEILSAVADANARRQPICGDRHHTKVRPETIRYGARASGAKLTDLQAAEIRREWAAGAKGRALAVRYGVSPQTISGVVRGERYPADTLEIARRDRSRAGADGGGGACHDAPGRAILAAMAEGVTE